MRKASIVAAIGVSALALFVARTQAVEPDAQRYSQIERGRYLARVADCTACHMEPGSASPFGGGRSIETPFGNLRAPNITPDVQTGIGAWSNEQFDNAVRKGIRRSGERLYPAMPYTYYTKMSRDDVLAIRAYLNTIAPVHNEVKSNTLPFPFNIRTSMWFWDALFFTPGEFKGDPQKPPPWNRGAYLVEGPGHCGACHTPKNFLGGDKTSQYLRGSNLQGWFAPEITNDANRGLGQWSVEDIAAYLRTGHNKTTSATGPMGEEIMHASSQMTDDDLIAMATYLKSVPGANDKPAKVASSDPAMVSGGAIYRDVCAACHGIDGKGVPHLFPALAESPNVRAPDPTTLIRLILRGSRSVATNPEPTAPGMPSFAWQLDDAQAAAVLTYVRNSWNNAAPAVSPETVRNARRSLQARSD